MRTPAHQARHDVSEALRRGVGVSTPERLLKSGQSMQYVDKQRQQQRIAQVPLDRLESQDLITGAQYKAGDDYRTDAYLSGVIPSLCVPTEPMGKRYGRPQLYLPGGEVRADAYRRWADAAQALGPELRPFADEFLVVAESSDTLAQIGARVFGRAPNKQSGAIALEFARLVLNRLIRHYDGT